MVGPNVSPRDGVSGYASDPTQGPACALACPAATVFRNYLAPVGGGATGQGAVQIDTLEDVGEVLGGPRAYWTMKNGYCMPVDTGAMRRLGDRLRADDSLRARCESSLRVGFHPEAAVGARPGGHRVAQVFCSALPVAYAKSTASRDWEGFARAVLRSCYSSTLHCARLLSIERGGERVAVFLTCVGGGAFGNRDAWIFDAIAAAVDEHGAAPLDVYLLHRGGVVPSAFPKLRGAKAMEAAELMRACEKRRAHAPGVR